MTDAITRIPAAAGAALPDSVFPAPDSEPDFGAFLNNVLDIVNPLQHLPVISTIYRAVTGDAIAAPARLIGDTLYGGPLGAASAAVNLAVEDLTGKDIGEHALELAGLGDGNGGNDNVQLASRDGAPPDAGRRELVWVAVGDAYRMTPDAETWNGEWRQPQTPDPQQAERKAPAQPAQQVAAAPAPKPETKPETNPLPAPAIVPADPVAADSPARPDISAKAVVPPPTPTKAAWLAAALADAEQEREAVQAGRPVAHDKAPVWVAAAMEHALDKYQAMALQRAAANAPNAAQNRP